MAGVQSLSRQRGSAEVGRQRSIPVTAIVMTKNEKRDLPGCLDALRAFSQVFVVDSDSNDGTQDIARDMGAHVIPFSWNGRYPKKKQWCLDNLPFANDWVLYADADERATLGLASEVAELMRRGPQDAGYFVGLDYVFLGKVLRHGHRMYKLSLLNRHKARFLEYDDLSATEAGEVELHVQPKVDGSTGRLRHRLIHHDHDSLCSYFERQNRYTDWEAVLRSKGGITKSDEAGVGWRNALKRLFNMLPGKPVALFLHHYVLKGGFLDGRAGFHWAIDRAVYYWQVGLKMHELKATRVEE